MVMAEALRQVVDDAVDLARRDPWVVAATVLLGTIPNAYATLTMDAMDAFRFSSLWGIVLYLPMVIITRRALAAHRAIHPDAPQDRILLRAFGQAVLFQLGVLAGLVCLLIPGVILFARWFVVLPVLISRQCTVMESFSISWELTGRNKGLVASVSALSFLPYLAVLLPVAAFGETTSAIIVQELWITMSQLASWLLSISLFLTLTQPDRAEAIAEDVFA